MTEIPDSPDRPPWPTDNPRHAVWIEDQQGRRRITAANPGDERLSVGGVIYVHTRELGAGGPWIYTKEAP